MISYDVVDIITYKLQDIAMQSPNKTRISLLKKLLNTSTEKERELLDLIFSFQANELFEMRGTYFNTIPTSSVVSDIRVWFMYKEHKRIPHSTQKLLYFMSNAKSLRLPLKYIMELPFTYICPYTWMKDNGIQLQYTELNNMCRLCTMNEVKDTDVCDTCYIQLEKFIEYRQADFVIKIEDGVCPWLLADLIDDTEFTVSIHHYTINKKGRILHFTRLQNSIDRYQQLLPFEEYQVKIQ